MTYSKGGSVIGPPYPLIKELVINLDNGPSVQSHRTQFLKRLVACSENSGLTIRLICYPPYHSQYNPGISVTKSLGQKLLLWRVLPG
jgi:hypothetical protein